MFYEYILYTGWLITSCVTFKIISKFIYENKNGYKIKSGIKSYIEFFLAFGMVYETAVFQIPLFSHDIPIYVDTCMQSCNLYIGMYVPSLSNK